MKQKIFLILISGIVFLLVGVVLIRIQQKPRLYPIVTPYGIQWLMGNERVWVDYYYDVITAKCVNDEKDSFGIHDYCKDPDLKERFNTKEEMEACISEREKRKNEVYNNWGGEKQFIEFMSEAINTCIQRKLLIKTENTNTIWR